VLVHDDFEACYRAVQSKDARFDGWFFVVVTSTGIYCRPSCPARTPLRSNLRFLPSAAAAQRAGYRACKRCRPDASPGSPDWDVRADAVARAMRMIADGVIDREGVGGLAAKLGYSVRQLERQMVSEVGAPPLRVARAQRAQTARLLIETTDLGFTEIAFAAGFASIRQFNDTVRETFASTPTQMRARVAGRRDVAPSGGSIHLRLPLRVPWHPDAVLGHLVATAVPGVEEWEAETGRYRRTLRLPGGHGVAALGPRVDHVACTLRLSDLRDLATAVTRCRWLLDLDADPVAVDGHLGADADLAPLVAKAPGQRIPRTVDGSELAVRAVIGQQISTAAARTLTARLVAALGDALARPDGTLTHVFPAPDRLIALPADALAMPLRRRRTVEALAASVADGTLRLDPGADRAEARARLAELPGVGPWTVAIVSMRALGDPDALPLGDLGVLAAARALGLPAGRDLAARAQRWRPWRSYATQHLWSSLDHPINRLGGVA